MKHTPGPWTAQGHGDPDDQRTSIGIEDPDESMIAKAIWSGSSDEQEANARLIAAAPDLLAALKDLRDNVLMDDPAMWRRVDDAIAKAEGRTP